MKISRNQKRLIKLLIIVLSYGYVTYRLLKYDNTTRLLDSLQMQNASLFLLILVLILMPVNWGIEAVKWKYLVKKLQKINFFTSFRAVMAGITVSIFTPNRVGEFGGRIFVLNKENRISGIFSTLVGSIGQLIITIFLGMAACVVFVLVFPDRMFIPEPYFYMLVVAEVIISILLILLYFNVGILSKLSDSIRFLRKYNEHFDVLKSYTKKELFIVLLYSLLRFVVFTFQYYLLLLFFNIDIDILVAFMSISIAWLMMAMIPSVSLAELGIRGSVSLAVIGLFSENSSGIVAASVLLWFVNLVLPSLIGSVIFYRMRM